MSVKLAPLAAVLALAACIPRGGDDYRIGRSEPAPEAPSTAGPQLVPEQDIIADTPSWSPATVERNAERVVPQQYIVQPGDSLSRIELRTGAAVDQIAAANGLAPPYAIRTGQNLGIPGGLFHRVGQGETGIAIARAYATSWADIVALNGLQHPYILRAGQRLRLPDGTVAIPAASELTPEQRAAAFTIAIDDIVTGGEPAVAIAGGRTVAPTLAKPTNFFGTFGWPLGGNVLARFGSQGGGRVNDGINIAGAPGTAVRSAANGIVVYSGNEIGVFGGLVLVDHGDGWVTAYGHLGRLDVVRGDRVTAGQSLGGVGDTGYVTEPQLHFEIRKDRRPVDPLTRLAAR